MFEKVLRINGCYKIENKEFNVINVIIADDNLNNSEIDIVLNSYCLPPRINVHIPRISFIPTCGVMRTYLLDVTYDKAYGRMIGRISMLDNEVFIINGVKQGNCIYYNNIGDIVATHIYVNDKIVA